MQKITYALLLAALLQSCSLLQRAPEEDPDAPPFPPSKSDVTQTFTGEGESGGLESEVAQLNTKISALETKLDVLSASMERMQATKSQPVIEAEMKPQAHMAAPVETESSVMAAPSRPEVLPETIKSTAPEITSEVERDFRAAMEQFQNGKSLESASKFALLAKKNPKHLLASHSLYWAGEASGKAGQWSLAIQNWEELEKFYPRSAYLPDALAGLARAYEHQGDIARAKTYKNTLLQSFPKSPIAMSLSGGGSEPTSVNNAESDMSVPKYEDHSVEQESEVD